MRSFIVKGKLLDSEVKVLERDKNQYSDRSFRGGVKNSKGSMYDDSSRVCNIYFAKHYDFPNTANILQSLLIENYHNIYRGLDYSELADLQYVKYDEGGFFRKHQDVLKDDRDDAKFRALTMSVNMSHPDDYDGGELVVYNNAKEIGRLDREKGSFIIIPSFFLHEAEMVERGRREAIVTWLMTDRKSLGIFKQAVINSCS